MSREEVFEIVNEIFRDVFDDDELEITDVTTAEDIEDWDSLEQINLIVAMQSRFGVRFSVEEAYSTANVGEMVDIIISKM